VRLPGEQVLSDAFREMICRLKLARLPPKQMIALSERNRLPREHEIWVRDWIQRSREPLFESLAISPFTGFGLADKHLYLEALVSLPQHSGR
jgi:hypothetical protein